MLNPNQLRRDYDRPSAVRSVVQFDKFQRIFELILLSFLFHGDRGSREPAEGGAPAWAEPFLDRFVPAWAVPLLVWKMTQKSSAEQMIFFCTRAQRPLTGRTSDSLALFRVDKNGLLFEGIVAVKQRSCGRNSWLEKERGSSTQETSVTLGTRCTPTST